MIFSETEINEKRTKFLNQLNCTREISVLTYNSLLSLSENPFLTREVFVNDMPLEIVLGFLERTVDELSSSLYEEMASISSDVIWLNGFTEYLWQRSENIKNIDLQSRNHPFSLPL